MNERIKELKDQCWVEKHWDNGMWVEKHIDQEKFAELIIEEACQAFWSNACNVSDLAYEEYRQNSKKIKQHFEMPI